MPKKIKDLTHLINLDEYADAATHWIALFFNRSKIVYFSSFGVEHVSEEIEKFVGNKNVKLTFFEHKQTIQQCVGTFALNSLILCLQVKN